MSLNLKQTFLFPGLYFWMLNFKISRFKIMRSCPVFSNFQFVCFWECNLSFSYLSLNPWVLTSTIQIFSLANHAFVLIASNNYECTLMSEWYTNSSNQKTDHWQPNLPSVSSGKVWIGSFKFVQNYSWTWPHGVTFLNAKVCEFNKNIKIKKIIRKRACRMLKLLISRFWTQNHHMRDFNTRKHDKKC